MWDHGVQLYYAPYYFAPIELKEKWDQARSRSGIKAMSDAAEYARLTDPNITIPFLEAIKPAQEIWNARLAIQNRCEEIALDHLKSGVLRAFAFEAPRTLASPAIELPTRLWHYQSSFSATKIMFESITFLETRVIGPKRAAAVLQSKLPAPEKTNRVGRPSYKADIERAFFSLLADDVIDLNQSIKSQTMVIREWLRENCKDYEYGPDKPGYDLIRKTLNPLIATEQKKAADKL